jgi:diaminopimelate dehydrogenase
MSIRAGIAGYGNLGRGAELALAAAPDLTLCAVFTRRGGLTVATPGVPVVALEYAEEWKDKLDVMLLCGGSAKDLPEQGPKLAAMFNTADTYDTHAAIPDYLSAMNKAAQNTASVISAGWDPGLFSMMRLLSGAVLPGGVCGTFWGPGVSQGHSDAVRRIPGVKDAVQYTIPVESAVSAAREGIGSDRRHTRECFVVAEEGSGREEITRAIKTMPHYFAGYDTTVNFITQDELLKDHAALPHGGCVIRTGNAGTMEFSLKLQSNPEFTASVLVACARAAVRLAREGNCGAKTVFDIPLTYLSPVGRDTLIKELL